NLNRAQRDLTADVLSAGGFDTWRGQHEAAIARTVGAVSELMQGTATVSRLRVAAGVLADPAREGWRGSRLGQWLSSPPPTLPLRGGGWEGVGWMDWGLKVEEGCSRRINLGHNDLMGLVLDLPDSLRDRVEAIAKRSNL